jgi:hypothetical protein
MIEPITPALVSVANAFSGNGSASIFLFPSSLPEGSYDPPGIEQDDNSMESASIKINKRLIFYIIILLLNKDI